MKIDNTFYDEDPSEAEIFNFFKEKYTTPMYLILKSYLEHLENLYPEKFSKVKSLLVKALTLPDDCREDEDIKSFYVWSLLMFSLRVFNSAIDKTLLELSEGEQKFGDVGEKNGQTERKL